MVSADAVFLIGKATECFLSEVACDAVAAEILPYWQRLRGPNADQ